MFNRTLVTILPALFLLLLSSAGCSKKENPAEASPSNWREPAVGSYYRFDAFESLDSTGNAPIDNGSGLRSLTNTVIATGRTYKGIGNLVALSQPNSVLLLDHRSNGDLAFIVEGSDSAGMDWSVLPVGSRGTTTTQHGIQQFIDPYTGDTSFAQLTTTASYAGSETLMVDGDPIATHRIDEVLLTRNWSTGSTPTVTTSRAIYWVAPTIGYMVKRVVVPGDNTTGEPYGVLSLKSYLLK